MSVNIDSSLWRLKTGAGIPYKLVSQTGSFEEEGAGAQEVVIIRASDLASFVLESFPLTFSLLGTVFYPPRRRLPGFLTLRTKKISYRALNDGLPIDPFSADTQAADGTYDQNLEVTIDYGTSSANDNDPSQNDPKSFLEITAAGAGSYITFNPRAAEWEADKELKETANTEVRDPNMPFGMPVPEVEWTLRWDQIPFSFFDTTLIGRLRGALGKVNESTFSLIQNAPAETILFLAWNYREQYTWRTGLQNQPPVQLEMKFLEKNFVSSEGVLVTHNHFFRPYQDVPGGTTVKSGWRRLLVDSGAGLKPAHDTTDFATIFSPS